jgi:signal transduction histidine kinase
MSSVAPRWTARRSTTVLLVLILVEAVSLAVAGAFWWQPSYAEIVVELLISGSWVVCGYAATRVASTSRTGMLMLIWGALDLFVDLFGNYGWVGDSTALDTLAMAGRTATYVQLILAVHIAITFPSGRSDGRATRAAVVGAWVVGAVATVATVSTYLTPPELPVCATRPCRPNIVYVVTDQIARVALKRAAAFGWLLVIAVAMVVVLVRIARAGRRERRVRALPTAVFVAAAALLSSVGVRAFAEGTSIVGSSVLSTSAQLVLVLAYPVAAVLSLARERLDLTRVSDLVRQLAALPVERMQPALATALTDPHLTLELAPPVSTFDSRRQVTAIEGPDGVMAWLTHDRSLLQEPRLLEAVRSAVSLAIANSHLADELQRHLLEARASRVRLVEAADEARRRLERDLHDGAQQRLLAIGLALQTVRQIGPSATPDAAEILVDAENELRNAIAELRELARGIHPAILSERGLGPAVEQLAQRVAVPVTVSVQLASRPPGEVETTAYFLVSEALTNVMKHARAGQVRVTIRLTGDELTVEVADDGAGGAAAARGSGLAGLADRVAALDGEFSLTSPPGRGTVLRAVLPTAVRT